jgi:glycerol-3-phosphate acyltransferase PlsY
MTAMMIACCLTAFVVGGIPFGYLVGHLILKDDIRKHGSGNIGATNVARVIGWKWGSIVLILDAIKGLSPTLAAKMLLSSRPDCSPNFVLFATIATGIAAILGHMYPVWLRLRGGKGVATALGVVLVIAPKASLAALGLFLIVVAITKIVAMASIAASIGFAVTQLTILGPSAFELGKLPLTLFSIIVPGLIVWRHRSNIARMWQGKENKIAKTTDTTASSGSPADE